MTTPKYVIDTCSLTALRRVYPSDVFPGVWAKVEQLVDDGVMASCELVLDELNAQDDEVSVWAADRTQIFLPLVAQIQNAATSLLRQFPTLIDLRRRKSGADPFVIATAQILGCAVVTEEKRSGGPPAVKIPDVCAAFGIACVPVLQVLRSEGLSLR